MTDTFDIPMPSFIKLFWDIRLAFTVLMSGGTKCRASVACTQWLILVLIQRSNLIKISALQRVPYSSNNRSASPIPVAA